MPGKKSNLVIYGQSETEALEKLGKLSDLIVGADNKSELFRKGLHCVLYLARCNERQLMVDFRKNLRIIASSGDKPLARGNAFVHSYRAYNLGKSIAAVMIAKNGLTYASTFEGILKDTDSLVKESISWKNGDPHGSDMVPKELQKSAQKIISALETIFLRRDLKSSIPADISRAC